MDQRPGSVGGVNAIRANDDDFEETDIEVTRAQIEQTRSEMSETIEAIKEKLNPQVLMSQAKVTVTDAAETLAQRAKDTVHDVASDVLEQAKTSLPEVTSNLAQRAKDTVHDVTADVLQQAKTNLPEVTSNLAHQAVHGAVSEAKEAVGSAVHSASEAVGGAVETARDAGSGVIQMIERNPFPAALIATGLGWFWMKARRDEAERQRFGEYRYRSYQTPRSSTASWDEIQRGNEAWQHSGQPGAVDSARQAVGDCIDTTREAIGHVAHSAQEAVGDAMDTARGAGSNVVEVIERNPLPAALLASSLGWLWMNNHRQAEAGRSSGRSNSNDALRRYSDPWRRYEVPSPTGAAGSGVAETLGNAQDRVSEVAGQIQDKAGQLIDQTQDRLSRLGSSTAQQVEQTADIVQRTLRQNPMAAGAVALGLGAAIGLLIPKTQQENQWMGEARDRVLHKAQETVQEVGLKAQIVAEEAIGAAKQEATARGLAPDKDRTS